MVQPWGQMHSQTSTAALSPGVVFQGSGTHRTDCQLKENENAAPQSLSASGAGSHSLWRAGRSCNNIHLSLHLNQRNVSQPPEIFRRLDMARAAIQDLDRIWGSSVALQTKMRLYDICIRPIALYASETWTVSSLIVTGLTRSTSGVWGASVKSAGLII